MKVHPKADLPQRECAPAGAIAVSAKTGAGLKELLESVGEQARALLPGEGAVALNRRQAEHLEDALAALGAASKSSDLVLVSENLRAARLAFDRITGRAGVEDVLDALFSRFCLGK